VKNERETDFPPQRSGCEALLKRQVGIACEARRRLKFVGQIKPAAKSRGDFAENIPAETSGGSVGGLEALE